ncbi:hypothetical protein [Photobacterium galatheae]|uniref:Uncharacterized protein n=1 Tax=Photobacterium galatheae TaxID=1654360 RepID=A0A066RRI9_9GAMM|nr:hypothetical protein [Photobacterium galatheae]KDM90018.1 hypothetical protein EA58_18925 [Photobacterium galatheae]MCM0149999.1 hypothetical protein [Photobacterium galatheae]
MKLVYQPFDFQSKDVFSAESIKDIKKVYITPTWNGTRRFDDDVEKLSATKMQIGDQYDSWQCERPASCIATSVLKYVPNEQIT